jgi:hypothetical protein
MVDRHSYENHPSMIVLIEKEICTYVKGYDIPMMVVVRSNSP